MAEGTELGRRLGEPPALPALGEEADIQTRGGRGAPRDARAAPDCSAAAGRCDALLSARRTCGRGCFPHAAVCRRSAFLALLQCCFSGALASRVCGFGNRRQWARRYLRRPSGLSTPHVERHFALSPACHTPQIHRGTENPVLVHPQKGNQIHLTLFRHLARGCWQPKLATG